MKFLKHWLLTIGVVAFSLAGIAAVIGALMGVVIACITYPLLGWIGLPLLATFMLAVASYEDKQ